MGGYMGYIYILVHSLSLLSFFLSISCYYFKNATGVWFFTFSNSRSTYYLMQFLTWFWQFDIKILRPCAAFWRPDGYCWHRRPPTPHSPKAGTSALYLWLCMAINKYTIHLTQIYYIYGIVRYCVVTGQAVEYSIRLIHFSFLTFLSWPPTMAHAARRNFLFFSYFNIYLDIWKVEKKYHLTLLKISAYILLRKYWGFKMFGIFFYMGFFFSRK